jgi:hypothetical protein
VGRPIKNGVPGEPRRAAALLIRVSADMKAGIIAEALRQDQSQSTVAARWLEKGQFWAAFERRVVDEDVGAGKLAPGTYPDMARTVRVMLVEPFKQS